MIINKKFKIEDIAMTSLNTMWNPFGGDTEQEVLVLRKDNG